MIRTENLVKTFWKEDVETKVIQQVNLDIKAGEFVSILGPSGSGKSTLLYLLGLLDCPTSGQLFFDGVDTSSADEKTRTHIRKENIGFVFQDFHLIDELTVFENVELPLLYHSFTRKERMVRTREVLEQMQISHREKHYPGQLSGGQQQRVAIARAIVGQPRLILADEPTGNLDSYNRSQILKLLIDLNEAGTTVVMVTHSEDDADCGQRIVHLFDGIIITPNNK